MLIIGETGTGKELVARAIHRRSAERDRPFIAVNCAAMPETLLESELFGHGRARSPAPPRTRRGASSWPTAARCSSTRSANTPALQAKLLRVLQEGEFEPLGSEKSQRVDVRVIAATNRDLRQMVSDGRFRQDLYYRLNVFPITCRRCASGREDMPLLVEHFVAKTRSGPASASSAWRPACWRALAYDWPGNVRELENTIERAVVLAANGRNSMQSLLMPGAPRPRPRVCRR